MPFGCGWMGGVALRRRYQALLWTRGDDLRLENSDGCICDLKHLGVYKVQGLFTFRMESTQQVNHLNIFTEDYKHFESNFEKHPDEAKAVFGYVAELRAALQAFREATLGKAESEEESSHSSEGREEEQEKVAEPDGANPASLLLGSADGSVEHQEIMATPIDAA
jgi:hypothetical protein